ncbi:decapping and exoribonuclease protein isoform X2 [Monomorium pharaonis]|uniref:decapping and exoribonuclease protein isoform X2 n=1 Tax=Monomorium pharaonis TaxID=307658 RepID=UPI00102E1652|nr:decapping and exoribonuclease protein isoform X2 [Monomorium pharaonis]
MRLRKKKKTQYTYTVEKRKRKSTYYIYRVSQNMLGVDFICSRGAIKTILSSPYKERDEWIICASKYHGTIYLCEFYTDEKEHSYANRTMLKKRYNSWGYKFEQYMVADHPAHKPDPSRALNECEEFHCMFKAKFDNHSLLYAAEIDGIFSQQFIKDTLIGNTFEIIELKTIVISDKHGNGNMYGKVHHELVSSWWSQNYLLELNRIICGLRDRNGTVTMIKEYNLHNLPKLSNSPYNVDKCKIFLKIFLNEIKKIVIKDYNKCMYKFHWKPSTKNVINYSEEAPDNEKYDFLKPWYIDKVEQYRKQPQ